MLISLCVVGLAVGAYMLHGSEERALGKWFDLIWEAVSEQALADGIQVDAFGAVVLTVENEPLGLDPEDPVHQLFVEGIAEAMAECWSEQMGCTHGTATIFEDVTVFRLYDQERTAELLGLRSCHPVEAPAEDEAGSVEEQADAPPGPDPDWNWYCIGRWCMGLAHMPLVSWQNIRWLWAGWYGEGCAYHHLSTWRRLQLFPIAVWAEFIWDGES